MDGRVILSDDFPGIPVNRKDVSEAFCPYLDSILIKQEELTQRTRVLAVQLADLYGSEDLGIICILNGAFRFFSMLTEHLMELRQRKGACTYFDFIRLKSYVDNCSGGQVVVNKVTPVFTGMHTLIVEDIVDTGKTLETLYRMIDVYQPISLKSVCLLAKRLGAKPLRNADFVGFEVPDRFVVGFGFDYNEHFRDLPHICVLSEKGKHKFSAKRCK